MCEGETCSRWACSAREARTPQQSRAAWRVQEASCSRSGPTPTGRVLRAPCSRVRASCAPAGTPEEKRRKHDPEAARSGPQGLSYTKCICIGSACYTRVQMAQRISNTSIQVLSLARDAGSAPASTADAQSRLRRLQLSPEALRPRGTRAEPAPLAVSPSLPARPWRAQKPGSRRPSGCRPCVRKCSEVVCQASNKRSRETEPDFRLRHAPCCLRSVQRPEHQR